MVFKTAVNKMVLSPVFSEREKTYSLVRAMHAAAGDRPLRLSSVRLNMASFLSYTCAIFVFLFFVMDPRLRAIVRACKRTKENAGLVIGSVGVVGVICSTFCVSRSLTKWKSTLMCLV
jgi:hypothetical protein